MTRVMSVSPCGIIDLRQEILGIGNSNLIPAENIYVDKFEVDGVDYVLDRVFETDTELLNYLNEEFVYINSPNGLPFRGTFARNTSFWYYTNEELFTTIDIFMNYGLKQLVFKIGTPPTTTLEVPFTDTYPNGTTEISHQELFNMQEVQIRVGNVDSEPIQGTGHTYISVDPLFALNGKIEFPYALEDVYVYVTLTQKPA